VTGSVNGRSGRFAFWQRSPYGYGIVQASVRQHPPGGTTMHEHTFSTGFMIASLASVPFLQAARSHVARYAHLHGFKIQVETTWLDKP
jgi:hypothetical protein